MPISFSQASTRVGQLVMGLVGGPYAEAMFAFGEKMDLGGDSRVVKLAVLPGRSVVRTLSSAWWADVPRIHERITAAV
jgi:hypothetical protein